MEYLKKTFSVSYGSKEYRDGWEGIFGEKKKGSFVKVAPEPFPTSRKNIWKIIGHTEDGRFILKNADGSFLPVPKGCCEKIDGDG